MSRSSALPLATALVFAFGTGTLARAEEQRTPPAPNDDAHLPAALYAGRRDPVERRARREERLAALAIYTVVTGVVVGGSYLLRNDFVGRGVATTAAGWGGLGVGAAIGAGLRGASPRCRAEECVDDGDAAVIGAGLLGTVAGSIAGYLLTSRAGMSRVYTTAAGMAPFILIVGTATIAQW